jgi:hypothetical protein
MSKNPLKKYDFNLDDFKEGEVMRFMKDIQKESKSMMHDLTDIDGMLISLQERIGSGRADKDEILRAIENIRVRIGVLEREDDREMNEEEVAESLLNKLRSWMEQIV